MAIVESLGDAPISTAIGVGLNKFVSIFRNPVPGRLVGSGNDPYYRTYLQSTRGILIAKKHLTGTDIDISKGHIFQFNPMSVSDEKVPSYEVRPYAGLDYNDYIWSGGGERKISFQLFVDDTPGFHTVDFKGSDNVAMSYDKNGKDMTISGGKAFSTTRYHQRGVLDQIELLQSFTRPDTLEGEQTPLFAQGGIVTSTQFRPPPRVIFCYGLFYFDGLITQANIEYTAWDADLVPIRATVEIEFSVFEFEDVERKLGNVK